MLYIFNKSWCADTLNKYLLRAGTDSSVLFIEDAVYSAKSNSQVAQVIKDHSSHLTLYAVAQDLETRGITEDEKLSDVVSIDYTRFVELVADSEGLQFWF